jgi:hypothetical protein
MTVVAPVNLVNSAFHGNFPKTQNSIILMTIFIPFSKHLFEKAEPRLTLPVVRFMISFSGWVLTIPKVFYHR